jgi:hypothetical protein
VKSLFLGVSAVYLLILLVTLAVGPLLMLRDRLRRRAGDARRGPQA